MNHTQLIQQLITERGYKLYLEIGYGKGDNFESLQGLSRGVAVDPTMSGLANENPDRYVNSTSDEYFDDLDGRTKFDLIFIDGDHTAEQVERDIVNAWKHLKKDGALLLHDVCPHNEEMTRIPRETKQWTGTTFQAWAGLVDAYPELQYSAITDDFGIATIEFNKDVKIEQGFVKNISFDEYEAAKQQYFKEA